MREVSGEVQPRTRAHRLWPEVQILLDITGKIERPIDSPSVLRKGDFHRNAWRLAIRLRAWLEQGGEVGNDWGGDLSMGNVFLKTPFAYVCFCFGIGRSFFFRKVKHKDDPGTFEDDVWLKWSSFTNFQNVVAQIRAATMPTLQPIPTRCRPTTNNPPPVNPNPPAPVTT